MKIIKAAAEHAELVGYVHSNAWKSTYQNLFPKQYLEMGTIERRKEEFLNSVTNDNIQYYLVLENDIAVGIIKILTGNNICEIASIYFLTEYRNKGYGTETLNYLKKIYPEHMIFLWVLKENVKARHFYDKSGFKETGETRMIHRGNEYVQIKYEMQRNL